MPARTGAFLGEFADTTARDGRPELMKLSPAYGTLYVILGQLRIATADGYRLTGIQPDRLCVFRRGAYYALRFATCRFFARHC